MDFIIKEKYDIYDLVDLVKALRAPDGCPWDKVQTHETIRKDLLEEVYETVEAIDDKDTEYLKNGGIGMCMRKLKIGLDCDDVLYKCNSYVIQLENMARRAAGKEPLDIQRLTTYEPTGDDLDVRFEYFKTPAFYEYQPLMEGAVDFVNDLIDMGHDLFIISSMDRKFREIRMRRIAEDFPRINPENIFIAPRKDVFAVDVMLDDAVHNLQGDRAVNAQYPILMKKPWNERAATPFT